MIHLVCKCEIIYEYVDVMGSLQGVVFPQENIYVAMCEGIYGGNPQVAFRFHTFNDRKHEGVNN